MWTALVCEYDYLHCPGRNNFMLQYSDKLLQNLDTINLVTKSVLDENGDSYIHAETDVRSSNSCYILFASAVNSRWITCNRLGDSIECYQRIDETIDWILLTSTHTSGLTIYHFLFFLGTDKISFSVRSSLSTSLNNPYWQQLRNTLWAEKCLLVLKETIEDSVNEGKQHLDPLAALTWYLASSREQKLKLKYMEDPTIQLLCTISESWFIAVILFLLQIKNFRWTSTNKKEGYESWIGSISSYWITSRIDNSCQGSTRCSGMYCIAVINLNSHSPNAFNATIIKTVSSFFCDW